MIRIMNIYTQMIQLLDMDENLNPSTLIAPSSIGRLAQNKGKQRSPE